MQIKVTVRNDGDAPTSRLKAVSSSTNKLFDGLEFVFGRIEPGGSRTWSVPTEVRDAPTRIDDIVLRFQEQNGNAPSPFSFPLGIQGLERPSFAYSYQLIDDVQGDNLDGRVQRGEQLRLFVKVKNTGKGTSFRTLTTLTNNSGVGVFIRKGQFVLGEMAPNETKTASFTFDVQTAYSEPTFKLELMVYDDALREYVTDKLEFKIAGSQDPPQAASGTLRINTRRTAFRTWAADDAPIVGWAQRGAGFTAVGRYTGWYRVLVAPDRPAFVAAKDVTPGGTPTPQKFISRWQVTPPKVVVRVPAYATSGKSMRIDGYATDETRVSDLFVFVRNPDAKIDGRKIFYRSNGGARQQRELRFNVDVPLWPGANYVTVHARESEEVQSQETVIIFRKAPPAPAPAPVKSPAAPAK
jgi:carboxyl-terminal processing protease